MPSRHRIQAIAIFSALSLLVVTVAADDRPTVVLWPDGMPEPRVDASAPERVEKNLVLAYPYRIFDDKANAIRADIKLDTGLPPTFISQCADDTASLPQGSTLLFLDLITRKTPAELHVYQHGGHGYGMRPRPNVTGPTDWPLRAADWLRQHGWAKK